jgi:hypothetical protein
MTSKILEDEDKAKAMPDADLIQEHKFPTGKIPQFLVISEIQRRQDMRKRYASREEGQTDETVAEKIVAGALPSSSLQGSEASRSWASQGSQNPVRPPSQWRGPPGTMTAQAAPMPPPPQMMTPAPQLVAARGGRMPYRRMAHGGMMPYRRMAHGGMIPPNALVEDALKFSPDSLHDVGRAEQLVMLNATNMGIPTVVRSDDGSDRRLGDRLQKVFSNMTANLGEFRGDQDRTQQRFNDGGVVGMQDGSDQVESNSQRKGDRLGIDAFMANLGLGNNSISAEYVPGNNAWLAELSRRRGNSEFGYRRKFNQGGVTRDQRRYQLPPPGLSSPGLPRLGLSPLDEAAEKIVVDFDAKAEAAKAAAEKIAAAKAEAEAAKAAAEKIAAAKAEAEKIAAAEAAATSSVSPELKKYLDKLDVELETEITPPDYDELINAASKSRSDRWAIAMTRLGAGIASGEGFAAGALEGSKAIEQMDKDEREIIQTFRLAQLRGASETELANITRRANIMGIQIGAIPKPTTPAAQPEIVKLLAEMTALENAGKKETANYQNLEARIQFLVTPKNISTSAVNAKYLDKIYAALEAGEELTEEQNKIADIITRAAFLERRASLN